MKNNGFTLIELLAVIVILAIIALIATPIILGIINDAREKANERSVELYASAVRNAIAAYQLTNPNAPTAFSDLTVQYDGDVKCSVKELYEDGSFYLEGCKVNNGEKEYSYGTKQGSTYEGTMNICNPLNVQTEGTYTAGDKYECDVDSNKDGYDYIFYVLNSTSESVNLIMNRNICEDGTEATESNTCTYAWYKDVLDNRYGPITAMNYLQTATRGWTNTNELIINTFTACDDEGICTDKPMTEYVVNARMPYYGEISDYIESANDAYLYDNLGVDCYDDDLNETSCDEATEKNGVFEEGIEHIQGVRGYWTLSSLASNSSGAWYVDYYGYAYNDYVDNDGYSGVRPVINLSI